MHLWIPSQDSSFHSRVAADTHLNTPPPPPPPPVQLLEAVDHMHSCGVAHRDLKPENICFLSSDLQHIKLIDLGTACAISDAGFSEICGTPLYAAPEIVPWYFYEQEPVGARPPPYQKEVDYWAMGVALFVMLSGEAPFDQDQPGKHSHPSETISTAHFCTLATAHFVATASLLPMYHT